MCPDTHPSHYPSHPSLKVSKTVADMQAETLRDYILRSVHKDKIHIRMIPIHIYFLQFSELC